MQKFRKLAAAQHVLENSALIRDGVVGIKFVDLRGKLGDVENFFVISFVQSTPIKPAHVVVNARESFLRPINHALEIFFQLGRVAVVAVSTHVSFDRRPNS